jgi:uncharacterized protein YgbK (DUF1537 family)
MPPERWLVLADDLTGAADTAMAFARAGWSASVAWNCPAPEDAVLARDAETRRLSAAAAAARHRALLGGSRRAARTALFKKIDSTLRGQPAAELAASLHVLRDQGQRALALVAPAFPSQGRTVEDGRIRLHGRALEETPLWAHEHSYPGADLRRVLEGEGLRVRHAPLAMVRDAAARLRQELHEAIDGEADALVCDAVTEADLAAVVHAARPLAMQLLWVGSAGLASALAAAFPPGPQGRPAPAAAMSRPRVAGGILASVGSLAEASRAGAALLARDPGLLPLDLDPATLHAGPEDPRWRAAATAARDALAAGRDVAASIAATPMACPAAGPLLAQRLAELLRPAAPHAGALIATGGETALALLDAFGINGIRMLEEIEPGVPLGLAGGIRNLPVITKAGAFGDAGTLPRCLAHLRCLRANA